MTAEGRLARGKLNYEAKVFPNNSETIAYVETIKEKPKVEKPKEKENAKPAK